MIYKGSQIKLDLEKNLFMRENDKSWHKLYPVEYIAITSVRMSQVGGGRAGRITYKYNAFCVYIKSGKLNILAYRGKLQNVNIEASKLSKLFDVQIKDFIPRDENGKIKDDDLSGCLSILIAIISFSFIILFLVI